MTLYNNAIIETPEYQQFLHISQYFYGTEEYYKYFYANGYPVAYRKILKKNTQEIQENNTTSNITSNTTNNANIRAEQIEEMEEVEVKMFYIYPLPISLYEVLGGILQSVFNLDEEKMQGKDPRTIKLSYLDFLMYKATQEKDDTILLLLYEGLEHCLHLTQEQIKLNIENGQLKLYLDNVEITHQEFDDIRNIILEQNGIEKVDLSIHPTLRASIRKAEEFKRKHNKNSMCSLEDLKYRIMGRTGLPFREINSLTIRQFIKLIESLEVINSYDLNMILAPNMEKKDQKNIKHWLSNLDKKKNIFEENGVSLEEMEQKLQS